MDDLDLKKTIQTSPDAQRQAPSLAAGDTLGQYRIIRLLGRGGMGEVYEVENVVNQKHYALKVLPRAATASTNFIDRFRVESRVMSDLRHEHIVQVHHTGEDQGLYYLTMDFVCGPHGAPRTLEDELADGKLPEARVRALALELCEALAYSHGHEVVHRDLKPANILLDAGGHAHVADFGLAKVIGAEYLQSMVQRSMALSMAGAVSLGDEPTLGRSGSSNRPTSSARAILGTYDYMAPEQKVGGAITARTDIYALGVMLYRMLTGRKPEGRWEVPSFYGCSKVWDAVVVKCMRPEPADRWGSVTELRTALSVGGNTGLGLWAGLAVAALVVGAVGYWAITGSREALSVPTGREAADTPEALHAGRPSVISSGGSPSVATGTQPARNTDATVVVPPKGGNGDMQPNPPRVTLSDIAPLKSTAEMKLAKVLKLADGQGFAALKEACQVLAGTARTLFEGKDYAGAKEQYEALGMQCDQVLAKGAEREAADGERVNAEAARTGAGGEGAARLAR
ncbi:MAG: serine/threonine-protein kinase, partial [bacterium]